MSGSPPGRHRRAMAAGPVAEDDGDGAGKGEGMEKLECPRCGTADVTKIEHHLDGGGALSFFSCHRCEHRWWIKDGESVSLPDVLDLTRRKKAPSPQPPA